jgi:hypothetical protein
MINNFGFTSAGAIGLSYDEQLHAPVPFFMFFCSHQSAELSTLFTTAAKETSPSKHITRAFGSCKGRQTCLLLTY